MTKRGFRIREEGVLGPSPFHRHYTGPGNGDGGDRVAGLKIIDLRVGRSEQQGEVDDGHVPAVPSLQRGSRHILFPQAWYI